MYTLSGPDSTISEFWIISFIKNILILRYLDRSFDQKVEDIKEGQYAYFVDQLSLAGEQFNQNMKGFAGGSDTVNGVSGSSSFGSEVGIEEYRKNLIGISWEFHTKCMHFR
jgi:hypothetical protein